MTRRVLLDTGVLSLVAHPTPSLISESCVQWVQDLLIARDEVYIPEVADYEVRREYLRRNNRGGIRQLDSLPSRLTYLALTTDHWLHAAELWAISRQQGHITAPNSDLDIDVLLAAQALSLAAPGVDVVIGTTNVRHLAFFVDARRWQDI